MELHANIKIILKVWFGYVNVMILDQNHNFYANGGNSNSKLCSTAGDSFPEFVELGYFKHISIGWTFSLFVDWSNHVQLCGLLEKTQTINTTTKIPLTIPNGDLIDIGSGWFGANILLEQSGVKKVFYIGKSNGAYYDLGVNQVTGVDWSSLTT